MTNSEPPTHRFPDVAALVKELASQIAAALKSGIDARGAASLVVSGGKSPVTLFEALRLEPIDWSRVSVALVDERWVEGDDPDSNEKLVRDNLLRDNAAAARFFGLKGQSATPDAGARAAWEGYAAVPKPFDFLILGMGDDGHTASLFPNSPNLARGLDLTQAPGCIGMVSPSAPRQRLSLNLSALLDSRRIGLYINGDSKWRTYVKACAAGPVEQMPIRAILRQQRTPADVFWSPDEELRIAESR